MDYLEARDLEQQVDYAVVDIRYRDLRPVRGTLVDGDLDIPGEHWIRVFPPDSLGHPPLFELSRHPSVKIAGRWADEVPEHPRMTWRGLMAHAYDEVLRQQALCERLERFEIHRVPQAYFPLLDENVMDGMLALSYGELDLLVSLAEGAVLLPGG
jgi:hypothetical protein